jgi:hypothetical protein
MRAALLILVVLASPAAAQTPQGGPSPALAALYACAAEADDAKRLACYDAAAGRLRAAEESGDVVAVSRAEAETIERESFGFSLPSLPHLFGARAGADAQAAETEMEIARIGHGADGAAVFTMTNGQVWAQVDTDSSRRARAGGKVVIRRAAFGSYLMHVEAGGPALRVQRRE